MNYSENQLIKYVPLGLVILNLLLKGVFISSNSLGGDEPFSVFHAQLDVSSIIHQLSQGNNPPLYELILHFWIKLFGISELSVRVPSMIFSSFTALYIYLIGKEFFSYPIAILSSIIFTCSNYHLAFSHEARVYSLFALLTTMSMFYFMTLYNKEPKVKYYLILLVINTLLLYAHYFGFFVIIIQTLAVFLIKEIRTKVLKGYVIYILGLTLLYIPNLTVLWERFMESSTKGTWVQPPDGFKSIYNMLWQFSNKPITTVFVIFVLIAALIKIIADKRCYKVNTNTILILSWFIAPFIFMYVISYWIPMFLDRYLIFVSIGFYLVLSLCIVYLSPKGKYYLALPSLLLILFIFTFNPNVDNKRHVRETVEKIKDLKNNRTKVLVYPKDFVFNFAYYYNQKIFQEIDPQNPPRKIIEGLKKDGVFLIDKMDEVMINDTTEVIYLDASTQYFYHNNDIYKALEKTHKQKNHFYFYEIFNVFEFECLNKDRLPIN